MFNFRYLKPYYTQSEVLELFSLSKSTLQRYREEVMKKGGDLWVDLGYFHIDGTKEAMYEPVRLSNWLLENKINIPKPYDYQVDEIKKVKDGLVEFPNFKKKNKEKLNAKIIIKNGIGSLVMTGPTLKMFLMKLKRKKVQCKI